MSNKEDAFIASKNDIIPQFHSFPYPCQVLNYETGLS